VKRVVERARLRRVEDVGQGGGCDDSQRGSGDGEGRRCGRHGGVLQRRGCSRQGSVAQGRSEDGEAQMKSQGKAAKGGAHREEAAVVATR
jgi:hypothetical protein